MREWRVSKPSAARSATVALALVLLVLGCLPSRAQQPAPQSKPPEQVQQLLHLLQDPAVRAWINQQQASAVPTPDAAAVPVSQMLAERIARLRDHLGSLAISVPRLPDEFRSAALKLLDELQGRSMLAVLLLVAAFLALGAGSEWLYRTATRTTRQRLPGLSPQSGLLRLWTIVQHLLLDITGVVIFTLGSVGAFLALSWPPLLRQVVLSYLIAAVVLRLGLVVSRFVAAPYERDRYEAGSYRLIPMSAEAARFWHRRLALFVGWFAFGWATVDVLRVLGFSQGARQVVAYTLGLGLLAISLEVTWSRPPPESGEAPGAEKPSGSSRGISASLISVFLVLLWALWVTGLMRLFWLGVAALLLPLAIRATQLAIRQALRAPDGQDVSGDADLTAVYVDRGVRALLIGGAVLLLAHAWGVDLVEMTRRDTLLTRLARGVLSSIVIFLVADFILQVSKTLIDRHLARVAAAAKPGSDEALRQARLRTLLPVFRYATIILVTVLAVLMALSALGVEIGPLIAGAGVVGVAVGFGSQTLVRDVISGIFYLLDDAFRIGEYIQSGNYKGTVESLGVRSLKLRHHRGPIYTVPYGQLGAVQNMSRDWVIDKITINVTYDTDLDKAKRIIKQIGKELSQDPEFASHIIEPLKMQGVEQFGDFAIQLRMKMMTVPGEQFAIRRKAYAMLKKAFDESGIKFAFPTVQVAGRDQAEPAAAQQALRVAKGTPSG